MGLGPPPVEKTSEYPCRRIAFCTIFNRAETARAVSGSALGKQLTEETIMAWTTPTLVEICIGLEINGYLPAEF